MPIPPAQLQAEFTAFLDRTGFDLREQWRHQAWVAAGMAGCLVVLWDLFAADGAARPSFLIRDLIFTVTIASLTGSGLLIMWAQDAQLRQLKRPAGSVEGRAARVSAYLLQRDSLLLLLALVGQAVAWTAGRLGVRLLSLDAPLVLLNLLATAQQLWLGFAEVPNRKRLVFLYKLIALHEARAAARAERTAQKADDHRR